MGILSINRNLLSKFKSKLKPLSSSSSYSSDPNGYIRRFLSAAAPTTSLKTHAPPTLAGDLKPKTMFLIEQHLHEGCRNYYLLSAAADGSSWKDNLHPISNPFSSEHELIQSCKEWTLFLDNKMRRIKGDTYRRRVSLWNPTTKRIRSLPLSFFPRPHPLRSIDIHCSGFGFEPKSQDYKVVCYLHYNSGFYSDFESEYHFEMYSLKTNSWKQIAPPLEASAIPLEERSVCLNGVYYWVTVNGGILSFDFADEKFSLFRLPKVALRNCYRLAEFRGSLALLVHSDSSDKADEPFWFEVQERPGKRWKTVVPRVTIGDDVLAGDRVFMVLGLFQNDYLFFQGRNKGELMLFNLKTSKLENLGVYATASMEPTILEILESNMLMIFPFFVPT